MCKITTLGTIVCPLAYLLFFQWRIWCWVWYSECWVIK